MLGEAVVNVLTLRERSDMLTLDDPGPGLAELAGLAATIRASVVRAFRQRWFRLGWVRRRLRRRAAAALRTAKSILFVCKGNICRSPFAHRVAEAASRAGVACVSAGYYPASGRPAPQPAVASAAQFGIDLSGHRSVLLTAEQVRAADAIFVFDLENYERVVAEYGCRRKVHLLGALAPDGPLDIADPYGADADEFLKTYDRIRTLIATR